MSMNSEAARSFAGRHRLFVAITGAVTIALIMTAISMSLYVSSGAQVLDLSRPGYEDVRQAINDSEFETDTFPQEGPVTPAVIDDFTTLYNKNRLELGQIDDFSSPTPLSDKSLQLEDSAN